LPPPSDRALGKEKNLLLFLSLRPLVISLLIFLSYPILFDIPRSFISILLISSVLVPCFLFLARILSARPFYYLIFITDTLLVTAIILFTGGSESLFPLLYPIIILISAIYLFGGAYLVAAISFSLYSILIYFELKGGFFPIQYFYARTYLYGILFFLVAHLGSTLATRLRRTEVTTAEIINSLPVKIAAIDNDGNLYYSNVSNQAIEKIMLDFYHSGASYQEISIDNRIFGLSSYSLTNPNLRLILAEDITLQKRMAEQTRISEKVKLLAQLGASLAHEIRNPLASIRGTFELVSKGKLSEKEKRLLGIAISEVDRATRTIEDFLEFSRMRPLRLRKVKLKSIIDDLISSDPPPKNIDLALDFPPNFTIRVDRHLFFRALRNLLQNAKQAIGRKKGEIKIAGSTAEGRFEIRISDTGCGIPKRNLSKIFDPFFSTREEGTGLGLAIVETIITQHGGSISVKSQVGKGTCFTITLPSMKV